MPINPEEYSQLDRKLHLHSFTDPAQYQRDGALIIECGEGIYLFDTQGNRYLDAMASLWCVTLGYGEKRLADAANRQLANLPFSHTFRGRSHPVLIELAQNLVELAPAQLNHVFFAGSGSEANESAIKMAWAYHRHRGRHQRRKIISRQNAYHGSTIFASRLCGMPAMQAFLNVDLPEVVFTGTPHFATEGRSGETEGEFSDRMARELEALIEREGADTIAAMIAEPVMAVGGVIVPPKQYFSGIQAVLEKYDILLIADEVVCGLGRTGDWFGSISLDIKPDLLTLAKGITSAYFPLSAVLFSDPVFQALSDDSAAQGGFSHGFTYSGHPVGAAISLEVLQILQERGIPDHAGRVGESFQQGVRDLTRFSQVVNPRGLGLMAAFDLVDGSGPRLMEIAEQQKLLIRAVGDTIVLAPPLIITVNEIAELLEKLKASIKVWSVESV